MPSKRNGYVERDSRGNQRIVFPSSRRASSQSNMSTRELLEESEQREQSLISTVSNLQARLSTAEHNEYQIRHHYQALVNQHQQCRNKDAELKDQYREVRRLDQLLTEEEDMTEKLQGKVEKLQAKVEKLEKNIKSLQRSLVVEDYKRLYEKSLSDIDLLTQRLADKTEALRLSDIRLVEKTRSIRSLTAKLYRLGYRAEDY